MRKVDPVSYLETLEQDRLRMEEAQASQETIAASEHRSEEALKYALGGRLHELGPSQMQFAESAAARMRAAENGEFVARPKVFLNKFQISAEGRRPRFVYKR